MRNYRTYGRTLSGGSVFVLAVLVWIAAFVPDAYGNFASADSILANDGSVDRYAAGRLSKGELTMRLAADGSPIFSRAGDDQRSPRASLGACNDGWDDRFAGGGGANARVYAVVSDGAGSIYIGGEFTSVGNISANYIAKWDGANWSTLGSGMNDFVTDLAWSGGNLYALGPFSTAGGTMASRVAKWDGSNWSALGAGLFGNVVNDLVVVGSTVYVAGYFLVTVNSWEVVRWDGSTWSRVGQIFGGGSGPRALTAIGSDVYAAGGFTFAGGGPADNIAKLTGSNWVQLGGGVNGRVQRLLPVGTDLYVGGEFTAAGGTPVNRIVKWDGSNWIPLGAGVDGTVNALAVSGTSIYAGGSFMTAGVTPASRIAKWDGVSWTAVGAGMDNTVGALAVSGGDVYVGGLFTMAGCRSSSRFARYFNQRFIGGAPLAELGGASDWFNPANWSNGVVPAAASDATIATADASITTADATVRDLRVDDGRTLTIAAGRTLTVTRNLNLLGSITGGGTVLVSSCAPSAVSRDAAAGGSIRTTLVRCVAGAGTFDFPVGTASGYSPVQLTNVIGTGNVSMLANEGAYSAAATGLPANRLARWWQIENPGGGITETDLIFNYQEADLTGVETDYRAYRISGGTASQMWGSINTTANTVSATDVTQFSNWTLAQAPPTSASVSVSGRVLTANGNGIRNAVLTLTAGDGTTMTARTGAFGYYGFDHVASGETYVLSVHSKRLSFSQPIRVISVNEDLSDVDFVANE